MVTDLEADILECEVKWALESTTPNKASGGDGIPVELFQILKDDVVKVLHSVCQQIWKTQQWPQDRKRSVFHQYSILTHIYGIYKDGNNNPVYDTAKETLMYRTVFWTLWERERVG